MKGYSHVIVAKTHVRYTAGTLWPDLTIPPLEFLIIFIVESQGGFETAIFIVNIKFVKLP